MYTLKRTPNGSVVFHGFPDFFRFYLSIYAKTTRKMFSIALIGWMIGSAISMAVGENFWKAVLGAIVSFSILVMIVGSAVILDAWRMWRALMKHNKGPDEVWNKVI